MIEMLRRASTEEALAMVLPGAGAHPAVAARSNLEHAGILVFPDHLDEVAEFLSSLGFQPGEPVPSTVVQRRLHGRYRLDAGASVWIIRGMDTGSSRPGREIEVFALLAPPGGVLPPELPLRERAQENESHVALRVRTPAEDEMESLRRLVIDHGGMSPDGGGYNPHHPAPVGTSVLYFSRPAAAPASAGTHRMELTCPGHLPRAIAAHQHETAALVGCAEGGAR